MDKNFTGDSDFQKHEHSQKCQDNNKNENITAVSDSKRGRHEQLSRRNKKNSRRHEHIHDEKRCGEGNSSLCRHGETCDGGHCCSEEHIGCGCGCVKQTDKSSIRREIFILILGAAIAALGFIPAFKAAALWIFIAAYVICGFDIFIHAIKNLFTMRLLDENFLMFIASAGAFAVGEYYEGIAVLLFYRIGSLFESVASGKAAKNINALLDIMPETATVLRNGQRITVSPKSVAQGELIYILPGERIPLDGVITEGTGIIDSSAVTGESIPVSVCPGQQVISGAVNMNSAITVKVSAPYSQSTVMRMLELTKSAGERKAHSERFITSFSKVYTPAVCFAALVIACVPPIITSQPFSIWIYRALTMLVISCPCALLLSVPLAYFGGIGALSANGIFVKGGRAIDALSRVKTIAFDKTGTLTKGEFSVVSVNPAEGFTKEELLKIAAAAEASASHPIAAAIRQAADFDGSTEPLGEYEQIPGMGICWRPEGRRIIVGNGRLMEKYGVSYPENISGNTIAYIAADGKFVGSIEISDPPRASARTLASQLARIGIVNLCVLTGDHKKAANSTARQLGINKVYAELLPHKKAEKLEQLAEGLDTNDTVAFCGDGINDAPSLAVADVGIAMGSSGTDAAIEAADVIIMNDNLMLIPEAIKTSVKTKRIAIQNIIIALVAKIAILILAIFGVGSMWGAVFADVGVCVITVLNAARCLGKIRKVEF